MQVLKLLSEKKRGQGWVKVVVANCVINVGTQRCMVERRGHREAYLSSAGWQASRHFVEVELQTDASDGQMYFLLKPELVGQMSASSNYVLSFVDTSGAVLDECSMAWKGVPSYVHIKTSVADSSGLTSDPSQINRPWGEPPVIETEPIWGTEESPTPWVPEVEVVSDPQPLMPELAQVEPTVAPEPAPPIERDPVFKIDCPLSATSPHGRHSIYSNTFFCPICSKPVR